MLNLKTTLLATSLLLAGSAAHAQYDRHDNGHYNAYQQGLRQGGHGDYNQGRYNHYQGGNQYNNGYRGDYNQHQGGIGPGKGALIGGGGGALLGGLLGGGLKGALIGGAAGAGIGAIAGKAHQNSVRRNDGYYNR